MVIRTPYKVSKIHIVVVDFKAMLISAKTNFSYPHS